MDIFSSFCNICYCTTKILNSVTSENERIKYILLSILGNSEIVNGNIIYLCSSCCEELIHFDKFRETCHNNFLYVRQQYTELKHILELQNDADVTRKLKDFVEEEVLKRKQMFSHKYKEINTESEVLINNICAKDVVNGQSETQRFVSNEVYIKCEIEYDEFRSDKNVSLDDNREDTKIKFVDSSNEQQDLIPGIADGDYKFHTEVDLDNSTEEYNLAENVNNYLDIDIHENDKHSGNSSSIICREKEGNSSRDILSEDNDSEGNAKRRKKNSYVCVNCNKDFKYKSDLDRHIRTHTGERPYKCNTCNRSYKQKADLDVHTRIHTGVKPYKCSTCDRNFTMKSQFNYHIRTHTGERPYKCSTCDRCFKQKADLDVHTRIHTGEKPYKCSMCDRTFTMKTHLNYHIRTHTGERAYKCSLCDRSFKQKCDLVIHTRIHTGERPYKCNTCGESFIRNSYLVAHFCK